MRKILLPLSLLFSCRGHEVGGPGTYPEPERVPQAPALESGGAAYEAEAEVSLRTKKFKETLKRVKGVVGSLGGYLVSLEVYESKPRFAHLTLAVPYGRLYELIDSLRSLRSAEVFRLVTREARSQEELSRLNAKLRSKREIAEQLRKLLAEAKTVSEAVEVERELAQVSEELAELEARLEEAEHRAKFARANVEITEPSGKGLPALLVVAIFSALVALMLALVGGVILLVRWSKLFPQ